MIRFNSIMKYYRDYVKPTLTLPSPQRPCVSQYHTWRWTSRTRPSRTQTPRQICRGASSCNEVPLPIIDLDLHLPQRRRCFQGTFPCSSAGFVNAAGAASGSEVDANFRNFAFLTSIIRYPYLTVSLPDLDLHTLFVELRLNGTSGSSMANEAERLVVSLDFDHWTRISPALLRFEVLYEFRIRRGREPVSEIECVFSILQGPSLGSTVVGLFILYGTTSRTGSVTFHMVVIGRWRCWIRATIILPNTESLDSTVGTDEVGSTFLVLSIATGKSAPRRSNRHCNAYPRPRVARRRGRTLVHFLSTDPVTWDSWVSKSRRPLRLLKFNVLHLEIGRSGGRAVELTRILWPILIFDTKPIPVMLVGVEVGPIVDCWLLGSPISWKVCWKDIMLTWGPVRVRLGLGQAGGTQ